MVDWNMSRQLVNGVDVQKEYQQFRKLRVFDQYNLPESISIVVNEHKHTRWVTGSQKGSVITLSVHKRSKAEPIREVLLHEVCHLALDIGGKQDHQLHDSIFQELLLQSALEAFNVKVTVPKDEGWKCIAYAIDEKIVRSMYAKKR